jgi:hypothetical protein
MRGDIRRVQRSDKAAADQTELEHSTLQGNGPATHLPGGDHESGVSGGLPQMREAQTRVG